jgi:hypothetical protein
MKSDRSTLGLAALVFPILTIAAMVIGSPPGGNWSAEQISDFVARGHRPAAFVGMYLLLLAAVALLYLVAALRRRIADGNAGCVFAATGFAAGTAWAVGAPLLFVVPAGLANGGHLPSDPAVVYMLTQVGFGVIFVAGGVMLAVALLAFASGARAAIPGWLRWLTLAAGILGLASAAFFPFFLLLIWSIVLGVYALATKSFDLGPM